MSDLEWLIQYEKHIRSPLWRKMKVAITKMRGAKCEHCGYTWNLQLHHKTYERLGNEQLGDLELVCRDCHHKADRKREAKVQSDRRDRALSTFASKKYGETYWADMDREQLEEEFDRWLESRSGY